MAKKVQIKLTMMTIYNWMEVLGFKYSSNKKTYYVDGHEKPETVAYRKKYVQQYIQSEIQCFRWIHLSEDEVNELEKDMTMKTKLNLIKILLTNT